MRKISLNIFLVLGLFGPLVLLPGRALALLYSGLPTTCIPRQSYAITDANTNVFGTIITVGGGATAVVVSCWNPNSGANGWEIISNWPPGGGTGGSVTSVAGAGDGTVIGSFSGSPITSTGTLTPVLTTQSANLALLGPTNGSASGPTFRSIVNNDLNLGANRLLLGGVGTSQPTGLAPVTAQKLLTDNGSGNNPSYLSQPVVFTLPSFSPQPNAIISAVQCLFNYTFPANFAGSYPDSNGSASCGTNPAENDAYILKVNGTQIGTATIGGPPAATLVAGQNPGSTCSNSTCTATFASGTTVGNIVVFVQAIGSTSFAPTVTDGNSTTLTECGPVSITNNLQLAIWYEKVATTFTTVTSGQAGTNVIDVSAGEFKAPSGFPASFLDACGSGTTGTSASVSTGNTSNTNTTDLVIAAGEVTYSSTPTVNSQTSGYTTVVNSFFGSNSSLLSFQSVSANASQNNTWSISASNTWGGLLLILKINNTAACSSSSNIFATTGGLTQTCNAGQRFEIDSPATVSGTNIALSLPAHFP